MYGHFILPFILSCSDSVYGDRNPWGFSYFNITTGTETKNFKKLLETPYRNHRIEKLFLKFKTKIGFFKFGIL